MAASFTPPDSSYLPTDSERRLIYTYDGAADTAIYFTCTPEGALTFSTPNTKQAPIVIDQNKQIKLTITINVTAPDVAITLNAFVAATDADAGSAQYTTKEISVGPVLMDPPFIQVAPYDQDGKPAYLIKCTVQPTEGSSPVPYAEVWFKPYGNANLWKDTSGANPLTPLPGDPDKRFYFVANGSGDAIEFYMSAIQAGVVNYDAGYGSEYSHTPGNVVFTPAAQGGPDTPFYFTDNTLNLDQNNGATVVCRLVGKPFETTNLESPAVAIVNGKVASEVITLNEMSAKGAIVQKSAFTSQGQNIITWLATNPDNYSPRQSTRTTPTIFGKTVSGPPTDGKLPMPAMVPRIQFINGGILQQGGFSVSVPPYAGRKATDTILVEVYPSGYDRDGKPKSEPFPVTQVVGAVAATDPVVIPIPVSKLTGYWSYQGDSGSITWLYYIGGAVVDDSTKYSQPYSPAPQLSTNQ